MKTANCHSKAQSQKECTVTPTSGPYQMHVFICTNQKKNGGCCASKGSEDLHKEVKIWAKSHPEWDGKIRINKSGCLDHCTRGIAIAIYPHNEWILDVSPSDAESVKARIEQLMAATKE
jgi:(2Fe-2S) ferredoxin